MDFIIFPLVVLSPGCTFPLIFILECIVMFSSLMRHYISFLTTASYVAPLLVPVKTQQGVMLQTWWKSSWSSDVMCFPVWNKTEQVHTVGLPNEDHGKLVLSLWVYLWKLKLYVRFGWLQPGSREQWKSQQGIITKPTAYYHQRYNILQQLNSSV